MDIKYSIIKHKKLPDGSTELYLDIEPSQQIYLGYILEALDGYCYHTISDIQSSNIIYKKNSQPKNYNLLKLTIVPDYYEEVINLLKN